MPPGRGLPILAMVLAAGALVAGCGGGDDGGGGNEDYEALLHSIKHAVTSNSSYDAVDEAEDLKPALRASIDAFCETNYELLQNTESWKVKDSGYFVSRIKLRAERELPFVSTALVAAAVKKYKGLFGLDTFEPEDVSSYANACYSRSDLTY
jgi:hypothetical protein